MKEISQLTFETDFDEIMEKVMTDKECFIIHTNEGKDVMLLPYDDYERIQGELTQLVE